MRRGERKKERSKGGGRKEENRKKARRRKGPGRGPAGAGAPAVPSAPRAGESRSRGSPAGPAAGGRRPAPSPCSIPRSSQRALPFPERGREPADAVVLPSPSPPPIPRWIYRDPASHLPSAPSAHFQRQSITGLSETQRDRHSARCGARGALSTSPRASSGGSAPRSGPPRCPPQLLEPGESWSSASGRNSTAAPRKQRS